MTGQNRQAQQDKKQAKRKVDHIPKTHSDHYGIQKFQLTKKQKQLGNLIIDNDLVFIKGVAGSGKSLGVLYHYVNEYLRDKTKQIIIVRTPVEAGEDRIGYLPSALSDKIEPHFHSCRKLLEQLLNKGKVESDLEKRIHFCVPNYILGDTLDNALILIDETQQLSSKTLKLLLERIGVNSTCCVVGDPSQLYVNDKKRNALTDGIQRFFIEQSGELYPRFENVDLFEFGIEDIQRSDIVKTVVKAYSDLT